MPNPEEISEVLAFVLLSGPKRSIFPQEQSGALLHLGVDYRIVGYVDTGGWDGGCPGWGDAGRHTGTSQRRDGAHSRGTRIKTVW